MEHLFGKKNASYIYTYTHTHTRDNVLTAAEEETLNTTLKMEAASSSEMLVPIKLLGATFQKTVIFTHVTLTSTFRNIKDYEIRTNFRLCILLFHRICI